jgi:DNA-binding NtrC family response regulator
LRERPSDIPALAAHFLQKHRRKGQPAPALSDAATGRLLRYPFPGNVRELENIVQRAIASARGTVLTEKEIEACLQPPNSASAPEPVFAGRSYPDMKAHLRRLEKDFLDQVLRTHAYRVAEAAKALGVARTALHNRIKALGIHVHR